MDDEKLNNFKIEFFVSKMLGHSKTCVIVNTYAHCVLDYQYIAKKVIEEIANPMAFKLEKIPQESKNYYFVFEYFYAWLHQK